MWSCGPLRRPFGRRNRTLSGVANSSFSFCNSTFVVNSKSLPSQRHRNLAGFRQQAVLRGRIEMRFLEIAERQHMHLPVAWKGAQSQNPVNV